MSDPSIIASDPTRSVWVAANAGAGKTYTLANRVARLLLADTRPERILCLTFTKAAAAEMQDRLFQQLGEWAMLDDAALTARIAGIGGDAEDLPKARRLFAQALETPGGLKVLTIHGFCQAVLSRFPLEAGVPPAFDVLDEQTARALAADARARVLERAGRGDAVLASAVAHIVTEASETRLAQILDAGLAADRRKLDRFFATLGGVPLGKHVRAAHEAPEETAGEIAENLCASIGREIEALKAARDQLAQGSANDVKQAARFSAFLSASAADRFPALVAAMMTDKGTPRASLATAGLAKKQAGLLDYLTGLQTRVCAQAAEHRAARAAGLAEAALTLLDAVRRDYAAVKRARGLMDYDDLIAATQALLEKRGAAEWVLFKLDEGIDHVLVDEAQDTSPEQWAILRKLTEEFFAGSGQDRVLRTLFAVGDEKQSIFSFQGADPAQFDINRRHFAGLAASARHPFEDQPLLTSRRSTPEILAFVDAVFASQEARSGLTSQDIPILHRPHRAEPGGIEIWPTLVPDEAAEPDIYRPVDALSEESPVVVLARHIADRIAGWLRQGARLPGHKAPIRPRDIMILLPQRQPFGGEVIRQLKLRHVPVAGADRIVLTEQMAVMDLMALGRFCIQREDDLTLAALLRSPLCRLSEEDLRHLAHKRTGSLWSALTAHAHEPPFAAAHVFLHEMMGLADHMPPFEFYSHALSARGGRAALLARLGPESADAVDEFLSLALTHERGQTPSLESFLDWVARGATEIKRDMERGRDEVRVMTVHGAKGLEADIVFLPDTARFQEKGARDGQLLYDGDHVLYPLPDDEAPDRVRAAQDAAREQTRKEHRRLLYVALTRARDRLIVCGFENRRSSKDKSWYRLIEDAAGMLDLTPTEDGHGFGTLALEYGKSAHESSAEKPFPLPSWVALPAPAEPARPRLIRPSEAHDGTAATGPGVARFLRGNVIHALLARLPELPSEERAARALRYALSQKIAPAEAPALVAEVLAVLDDPAFAVAFGPQGRAEAALLVELPELGEGARLHGRMDRLAVTDKEVLILDFKTNRPAPTREDDVAELYLDQMALYRAGAAKIYPGRRIVCGLLFTDGPRLLRLSDRILDLRWAEMLASRAAPGAA